METKDRLVQEALKLFAQRGIDAVGVQEIVETCGVTKPSLYHHFGSKEGLVKQILDQGFRNLTRELDAAAYQGDIREVLASVGQRWLTSVVSQPDFFRIFFSLVFLTGEEELKNEVRRFNDGLQKRMEEVFQAASVVNGNMRNRHRELAAQWLGLLNHWAGLYLNGWMEAGSPFFASSLRQFLYGIFS